MKILFFPMPRVENIDKRTWNTNDVQRGGSCTAAAMGNAMEIAYFERLGNLEMNYNIFWQWRNDEKGIDISQGSDFVSTYNLMTEFQNIFGGLPCMFSDGSKGIIKLARRYEWGNVRDLKGRCNKIVHEMNRPHCGVVFSIPTNSSTFNNCYQGGSGVLQFTKPFTGAHSMCMEKYTNYRYREVPSFYSKYRLRAPDFFYPGNSWHQLWGDLQDGTCKLSIFDFKYVFTDITTLISDRYETRFLVTHPNRINKALQEVQKLGSSTFRTEMIEYLTT